MPSLHDLTYPQLADLMAGRVRQHGVRRAAEMREAADMLDRTQAVGRNLELDAHSQRIGDQRDIAQIGQEPRAGLAVRMADKIAGLYGLAGQLATAGHGTLPFEHLYRRLYAAARKIRRFGTIDTIRDTACAK